MIEPEILRTSVAEILHHAGNKDLGYLINQGAGAGTIDDPELRHLWQEAKKAIDKVARYLQTKAGSMQPDGNTPLK